MSGAFDGVSTQDIALAIVIPLLGGLIVLVGVGGSFLRPIARRRIERYVFGPLFFVVGAALIGLLLARHLWLQLACAALVFALTLPRVVRMMRRPTGEPPPTASTAAGV